ncbi:MAG TPA: hypothetical protein VLD67_13015 [Vicinamibacterales bacterium]|nr:hypothetical protein [Vicinamibacterales bacterium]
MVLLYVMALGFVGWYLTRHITSFVTEFAQLLAHAERRGVLGSYLSGRSSVAGDYEGRAVTMEFQRADEYTVGYVVVAMKVNAPDQLIVQARLPSAEPDRDLEKALFALEARHELRVDVENGWLRARWEPAGFFIFPGRFDRARWIDVLTNMSVTASSLERRNSEC